MGIFPLPKAPGPVLSDPPSKEWSQAWYDQIEGRRKYGNGYGLHYQSADLRNGDLKKTFGAFFGDTTDDHDVDINFTKDSASSVGTSCT